MQLVGTIHTLVTSESNYTYTTCESLAINMGLRQPLVLSRSVLAEKYSLEKTTTNSRT